MTNRQALEKIGRTLTQVYDMPIKRLCIKEYAQLEKLVEENEKRTNNKTR